MRSMFHVPLVMYMFLYGFALFENSATATATTNYSFPVLPPSLPIVEKVYNGKLIPQYIWIAVKNKEDELPIHLKNFLARNNNWKVNICDNKCKDEFMNQNFAGTSILWAYNMIHPIIGAAKADIWRYCVLYTYGGLYIDDDSDIKTLLDEVVTPSDSFIIAEEGASSLGDCYSTDYHLSDTYTLHNYPNMSTAPLYHGLHTDTGYPLFFHGNTLVNWGIFTMPRHPLFRRVMENIVEIITSDYLQKPYVMMTKWDKVWKQVMCSTNFVVTYTLREMLIQGMESDLVPRVCAHDYSQYKGKAKAIWTGGDPTHYMKVMKDLLGSHVVPAPSLSETLVYLEGQLINSDSLTTAGRSIYLIQNGVKRPFNDYSTFLNMNMKTTQVRVLPDVLVQKIPEGEPMPLVENPQPVLPQSATGSTLRHRDRGGGKGGDGHGKGDRTSSGTKGGESSTSTVRENFGSAVTGAGGVEKMTGHSHHRRHHRGHHSAHPHPVKTLIETSPELASKYSVLSEYSKAIEEKNMICYKDDYAGTRDEFINGRWREITKETPVFVYPLCINTFQLGNTLGYYFNDLACAHFTGAHYLGVHKTFLIQDPAALSTSTVNHHAFMEALPKIVPHPNALSLNTAIGNSRKVCPCIRYCWENSASPWLKYVDQISEYMAHAIDAYIDVANITHGTILSKETDLIYYPSSALSTNAHSTVHAQSQSTVSGTIDTDHHPYLPLIPDVTIQYRCGDNIGFGKTRYGLLPFPAILSRIYSSAKHIYVIADSPSRSVGHPYNSRCGIILKALFDSLLETFPASIVIIKRGGDLFLDVARLAYSNITICSASTFCLWPALTNRATVHFPYTPLIAGSWTNLSLPDFGPHFHWIKEVEILKEFKQYKPWERVLDALRTTTYSD